MSDTALTITAVQNPDPEETSEWIEALQTIVEREGLERAQYVPSKVTDEARRPRNSCWKISPNWQETVSY